VSPSARRSWAGEFAGWTRIASPAETLSRDAIAGDYQTVLGRRLRGPFRIAIPLRPSDRDLSPDVRARPLEERNARHVEYMLVQIVFSSVRLFLTSSKNSFGNF
jgi:hypothetical protein